MAIPNPNPITLPPRETAQVFDAIWLSRITIRAPETTQGSATIEFYPYDSANQDILKLNPPTYIQINDMWAAMHEVPEMQTAMYAIFAAVPALQQWLESKLRRITLPKPEISPTEDLYEPEEKPDISPEELEKISK